MPLEQPRTCQSVLMKLLVMECHVMQWIKGMFYFEEERPLLMASTMAAISQRAEMRFLFQWWAMRMILKKAANSACGKVGSHFLANHLP